MSLPSIEVTHTFNLFYTSNRCQSQLRLLQFPLLLLHTVRLHIKIAKCFHISCRLLSLSPTCLLCPTETLNVVYYEVSKSSIVDIFSGYFCTCICLQEIGHTSVKHRQIRKQFTRTKRLIPLAQKRKRDV